MKKELFAELKAWSCRDDAFSLNDFLREKGIAFDEFELIANSSKKFMEIWGKAESRAWENLKEALFKKKIKRSRIAEYIRERDAFQGQDPKEVMRNLESAQKKVELYRKAMAGDIDTLLRWDCEKGEFLSEQNEEYRLKKDS